MRDRDAGYEMCDSGYGIYDPGCHPVRIFQVAGEIIDKQFGFYIEDLDLEIGIGNSELEHRRCSIFVDIGTASLNLKKVNNR